MSAGRRLEAHALRVSHDGCVLVSGAHLRLAAGELVALVGPSGAGKTSLLRALAGATVPDSGRLAVGVVGFVPAEDLVHDELTVLEELVLAARLRNGGAAERDLLERVIGALGDLGLTELTEARIKTLSTGQRRRVSVGVELVGRPDVLLLDEPASGVDAGLERRLTETLRRLADDGQAILLATHATASLHLCDRVVALAPGGTVAYDGPSSGLCAAFGVETLGEVCTVLAEVRAERIGEEPAAAAADGAATVDRRTPPTAPLSAQLPVLVQRSWTTRVRDTRALTLLLGQAPVIGLLMAVVLPRGVLADGDLGGFYGLLLSFMLLIAAIWLGTVAACRDLVGERAAIERELAIGVRPGAQVLAKLLTLLPLVAAQCLLLVGTVLALQPVGAGAALVAAVCVVTGWSAAAMGLWLSAWARTPDQATIAVPLVLIPQLLFAGALIPIERMIEPLRLLTHAVAGRWAFEGLGAALSLDERVGADLKSVTGLDGSAFPATVGPPLAALGLLAVVALVLAARALKQR